MHRNHSRVCGVRRQYSCLKEPVSSRSRPPPGDTSALRLSLWSRRHQVDLVLDSTRVPLMISRVHACLTYVEGEAAVCQHGDIWCAVRHREGKEETWRMVN